MAAVSSSEPPKEEVEYDEPIGLERYEEEEEIDNTEEVAIQQAEKPKKKRLFGGKSKAKPKKKDKKAQKRGRDDREESIFEQESDVEFELEGVEPIDDEDDSWDSAPKFDERVVEQSPPRETSPKEVEREFVPKPEPIPESEPIPEPEPIPETTLESVKEPVIEEAQEQVDEVQEQVLRAEDILKDEYKGLDIDITGDRGGKDAEPDVYDGMSVEELKRLLDN